MDTIIFRPRSLLHSPSNFSASNKSKLGRPTSSPKEIADGPSLFTSWSNYLQSTVSSNRADGKLRVRTARRSIDAGRSASENEKEKAHLSSQDEIIALFRRIRTSIAKGESTTSKMMSFSPSELLSAESISEILGESREQSEEKASNNGSDKMLPGWRGKLQKVEKLVSLATEKASNNRSDEMLTGWRVELQKVEKLVALATEKASNNKTNNKILWGDELQKVEKLVSLATGENRSTQSPSNFVKRSPVTSQPVPVVKHEVKSKMSSAIALKVLEDIEDMDLRALQEYGRDLGIKKSSKMKKHELKKRLLEEVQSGLN